MVDTLTGEVDKINEKIDNLASQLNTVIDHLEKIEAQLTELERKLDAAEYKKKASAFKYRRKEISFYYKQTRLYFQALGKCGNDDAKIANIASLWAESPVDGSDYLSYTEKLLSEFRNYNGDSYLNEAFYLASSCYPWEHQSYNFIYQALSEYYSALIPGVMLSFIHYSIDPKYEIIREAKIAQLREDFTYLAATYKAACAVINQRDAQVRHFNLFKNISFSRESYVIPHTEGFNFWLAFNSAKFPFSYPDEEMTSYKAMLKGVGLGGMDYITNAEVKTILDFYDSAKKKITTAEIFHGEKYCDFDFDPDYIVLFGKSDDKFKKLSKHDYAYGLLTIGNDRTSLGINTAFVSSASHPSKWYGSMDTEWMFKSIVVSASNGNVSLPKYRMVDPELDRNYNWGTIKKFSDKGFVASVEEMIPTITF